MFTVHVHPTDSFKVGFKARMLKLHRQCYALINFVSGQDPYNGSVLKVETTQGRSLLSALVYFHDIAIANTSQRLAESAAKLSSYLALYTAKSFNILLESCPDSLHSLPCELIEDIISKDCLQTGLPAMDSEQMLLAFVLDWGMRREKGLLAKSRVNASAVAPGLGADTHDGTLVPSGMLADTKLEGFDPAPDRVIKLPGHQDAREKVRTAAALSGQGPQALPRKRAAGVGARHQRRGPGTGPQPSKGQCHHGLEPLKPCRGKGIAEPARISIAGPPTAGAAAAGAAAEQALAETDRLLRRVRFPFVPLAGLASLGVRRLDFARRLPSYAALKLEAVAKQFAAAGLWLALAIFTNATGATDSICSGAGGERERASPRLRYKAMPVPDLVHIASLV